MTKRFFIKRKLSDYNNGIFNEYTLPIFFGLYSYDDSGSANEIGSVRMDWELIDKNYVPRLKCFDDGWKALATFTDLISEMSKYDNQKINQDQFIQILLKCGFVDYKSLLNE